MDADTDAREMAEEVAELRKRLAQVSVRPKAGAAPARARVK